MPIPKVERPRKQQKIQNVKRARAKGQGILVSLVAIVASLGLFAHAELKMIDAHAGSLPDRRSIVMPLHASDLEAGKDPRQACVHQLIQTILEPSPYAALQIKSLDIEPGYLSDSYQFTAWDTAGNDYIGEGYVTFSEQRRANGSLLECSQSSATGPWLIRSVRFSLRHSGSSVWEERDPIG